MAGVEIKGFEELRRDTERLARAIGDEAILAAEDAATEVVRAAVEAAAPTLNPAGRFRRLPRRPAGQLRSSVRIFESKDSRALTGSSRRRLLVGPEKKTGFYGFFLEKGWNTRGPKKGSAAHPRKSPRRVPARPWMYGAVSSIEERARGAGLAAFNAVIERSAGRG